MRILGVENWRHFILKGLGTLVNDKRMFLTIPGNFLHDSQPRKANIHKWRQSPNKNCPKFHLFFKKTAFSNIIGAIS